MGEKIMFISEYIKPKESLSKLGVFDALIDKDSHFFINIIRLKSPLYQNSLKRIIN